MADYTWTVQSTDRSTGHMIVEYTTPTGSVQLNVPMPPADADIGAHVSMYAPSNVEPEQFAEVLVGHTGETQFTGATEPPTIDGNWNEEYLRAMIYQVLEEVRESTV